MKRPIWKDEVCDNCKYSTQGPAVHWNLDYEGKVITLRCPLYENGKVGIVRGCKACYKFEKR